MIHLIMLQKKNNVIILNGPSSSGKTTVVKKFREMSQEIWLLFGVDMLWNNIMHSTNFTYDIQVSNYNPDKLLFGFKVSEINSRIHREQVLTEHGKDILINMVECINVFAKSYNVISEDVICPYTGMVNFATDCYTKHLNINNNRAFFFGLDCADEEIQRREKSRNSYKHNTKVLESEQGNGRPEGLAIQQKYQTHNNKIYDLMLDSTNLSAERLVQVMFNFINNNEPKALSMMRNKLSNNDTQYNTIILNQM